MTFSNLYSFSGLDGVRVTFSSIAVATFDAHQQRRFWHRERGGVLLATSVGEADGHVHIAEATAPHRDDRAGRYWLSFDHRRVLDEIHNAFTRGFHFVGYWHTHPEDYPQLSSQDVAALMPIIRSADLDLLRILMVVVGRAPILRVDACIVDRRTGEITRLRTC